MAQNRLRAVEGMEGLTRLRKLDLGANRIRWASVCCGGRCLQWESYSRRFALPVSSKQRTSRFPALERIVHHRVRLFDEHAIGIPAAVALDISRVKAKGHVAPPSPVQTCASCLCALKVSPFLYGLSEIVVLIVLWTHLSQRRHHKWIGIE